MNNHLYSFIKASNNHLYSFIKASNNRKTGSIPVTRTSKNSCPTNCEFINNGCYAEHGNSGIWWNRLNNHGLSFDELLNNIRSLPAGTLWRHNEAGDLPKLEGSKGTIDHFDLALLVDANHDRNGFTYTHYNPKFYLNANAIWYANMMGFTINISANRPNQAIEFSKLKYQGESIGPVVCTVTEEFWNNKQTVEYKNYKFVRCPAEVKPITCALCKLCAKKNRKSIVGFTAHGIMKKKVINIINKD